MAADIAVCAALYYVCQHDTHTVEKWVMLGALGYRGYVALPTSGVGLGKRELQWDSVEYMQRTCVS